MDIISIFDNIQREYFLVKKILTDVRLVVALAMWWGLSGFVVAVGVQWVWPPASEVQGLPLTCAALQVIVGLGLMVLAMRDPMRQKILFGEQENPGGHPLLSLLIGLPFSVLFVGLLWIVVGLLTRWFRGGH